MKKLLLATAVVAGASMGVANLAAAQEISPLQGTTVTKLFPGHASTYYNNNYMWTGTPTKGPVANPTPGTMVIHLGALVLAETGASWASGLGGATSEINLATGTSNKVAPIFMQSYVRLYPGVDAMAANGLRYGAAVEIRENFFGNPGPGASAETLTSGGTGMSVFQTLFVRREFVYLGADNLGVLRMGETDGVIGTFDEGGATTGVFLSPSGTIVGGDLQGSITSSWMIPYFAAQTGNEYASDKIFYDSPAFYGFDIAAEYAPHEFNNFGMAPGCLSAGTCPTISSSFEPGGGSLENNIYSVGVRYQGQVGPAAVLAYALYMGAGHANYTGTVAALGNPAGSKYNGQFDNLSLGMFGANVTVAGLSVFGNVMHGAFNGILAPKAVGAPDATGFGVGAKYTMGPWTFGGVYSQDDSQGSVADVGLGQYHAWVGYFAATYNPSPGLTFYADYGYGQTHQGGPGGGDGRQQGFLFGTAVTW